MRKAHYIIHSGCEDIILRNKKGFGGRSGKRKAIMGDVGKNKPSQRSGERGMLDAVKASVLF